MVAGYMPGDLYNLNSAYGGSEELKQCIDEMHKHNILVTFLELIICIHFIHSRGATTS